MTRTLDNVNHYEERSRYKSSHRASWHWSFSNAIYAIHDPKMYFNFFRGGVVFACVHYGHFALKCSRCLENIGRLKSGIIEDVWLWYFNESCVEMFAFLKS